MSPATWCGPMLRRSAWHRLKRWPRVPAPRKRISDTRCSAWRRKFKPPLPAASPSRRLCCARSHDSDNLVQSAVLTWPTSAPLTHARASTGGFSLVVGNLALATMPGLFLPALRTFANGTSRADHQIGVRCCNCACCGGNWIAGHHRDDPLRNALGFATSAGTRRASLSRLRHTSRSASVRLPTKYALALRCMATPNCPAFDSHGITSILIVTASSIVKPRLATGAWTVGTVACWGAWGAWAPARPNLQMQSVEDGSSPAELAHLAIILFSDRGLQPPLIVK